MGIKISVILQDLCSLMSLNCLRKEFLGIMFELYGYVIWFLIFQAVEKNCWRFSLFKKKHSPLDSDFERHLERQKFCSQSCSTIFSIIWVMSGFLCTMLLMQHFIFPVELSFPCESKDLFLVWGYNMYLWKFVLPSFSLGRIDSHTLDSAIAWPSYATWIAHYLQRTIA